MAKKKDKAAQAAVAGVDFDVNWNDINAVGDGLFEDVDPVNYYIDTGSLALNYVISGKFVGGGVPGARIAELIGDSATGKSLVGMNILKGAQTIGAIPILLDAECAFNPDFAEKVSKIDTKRLLLTSADTLERCFNKIYNSVRVLRSRVAMNVPIVILYDSIAASPSEREFAETGLDMETATDAEKKAAGAGADQPGDRAKICSKHFRNLPKFLKEHNATLIVINQFREKIGFCMGDNRVAAGGGRALDYYGSLRVRLTSNRLTKDKYEVVNGVNINVKAIKNRFAPPFAEARGMHLLFKQGINPFGGLLDILIQTERVTGTAGNYRVCEPYAQGQEIKFKASKERNDVPAEVLLQCPQLVDATSPEQIKYYLNLYQEAIDGVEGISSEAELKDVE